MSTLEIVSIRTHATISFAQGSLQSMPCPHSLNTLFRVQFFLAVGFDLVLHGGFGEF